MPRAADARARDSSQYRHAAAISEAHRRSQLHSVPTSSGLPRAGTCTLADQARHQAVRVTLQSTIACRLDPAQRCATRPLVQPSPSGSVYSRPRVCSGKRRGGGPQPSVPPALRTNPGESLTSPGLCGTPAGFDLCEPSVLPCKRLSMGHQWALRGHLTMGLLQ